jgi:hypothetical protein
MRISKFIAMIININSNISVSAVHLDRKHVDLAVLFPLRNKVLKDF